ncbi:hypothetical protein Tco_0869883 [Tanacetum coccineum]
MDCHAGNPCELISDLTAKIKAPMIRKMDGYEWQERGEQDKARSSNLPCLLDYKLLEGEPIMEGFPWTLLVKSNELV